MPDSMMVLPVARDGRTCGVLEVLDPDMSLELPDQLALLGALADQAALAL